MTEIIDQCKHCLVRGKFSQCQETPCAHHENWYAKEIKARLQESETERQEAEGAVSDLMDVATKNEVLIKELRSALHAALGWIDAVPEEAADAFPAMPGFDRDWANYLLDPNWNPEEV